jgi:magnesium chelatase subunit D
MAVPDPALRPGPAAGSTPVVGLGREREVLTVALQAARHVVLEGPPGTGKSTLLRSIARDLSQAVVFAEGNAELTPARLIGQYDPAQVIADGYLPSSFADGPLLQAMRAGALLYLEEFNRVPEETLNVLITVLTEGEIAVPRLGLVQADPGFRLIAAMNPFDAIGTARVSQAIADRICRIVLGYQDAAAERSIVRAVTGHDGDVVPFAVALGRATRAHRDIRMGASVRGAIDLVLLIDGLARLRGEAAMSRLTARDAAYAALSGRIRIADGCDRSPESVLDELLDGLWPPDQDEPPPADEDAGDAPAGGRGKADGPPPGAGLPRQSGSSLRRERGGGPARRSVSRAELASRHAGFAEVSGEAGAVDADALAGQLAADPDAAAALLADLSQATDPALRAVARQLAARIFIQLGAAGRQPARGPRRIRSVLRGEGDLDLDRTLDRLAGTWPPPADDLVLAGAPAPGLPAGGCQRIDVRAGARDGCGRDGGRAARRRRAPRHRRRGVLRHRDRAAAAGSAAAARGHCGAPAQPARARHDRHQRRAAVGRGSARRRRIRSRRALRHPAVGLPQHGGR